MIRVFLKFKVIFVVVLILLFVYGYMEKNRELEDSTQIIEIENTEEIYNSIASKIITIRKHYMILSPPENLQELKTLVQKFVKENFIYENIDSKKKQIFEIYFYRKSKNLPRNWQPNESYMETDRIEHHKEDLIVSIYWSNINTQKRYSIMEKSSEKNDYGKLIKSIEYIDNQIQK